MNHKMNKICVRVGDHQFEIYVKSQEAADFICRYYRVLEECEFQKRPIDLRISIKEGFGKPFIDFSVHTRKHENTITYKRADYLIEVDHAYRRADIHVHDLFALKHALMNLYSGFIVFQNWGLLVHSSCVINDSIAHLFAGRSGAGKSTAARLSRPRSIISDEATIMRVSEDGVTVFDSPFRSDSMPEFHDGFFPLSSINLLHQSTWVYRDQISRSLAMLNIMDKVFYWPVDREDTIRVFHLLQKLVRHVPAYELHFQKNDKFWRVIS